MINGFTFKGYNKEYINTTLNNMIKDIPNVSKDKLFIDENICMSGDTLYTIYNDQDVFCIALDGYLSNISDLKEFLLLNDVDIEFNLDEEIILKGYIKFGSKFIEHLVGSFSFCIYDNKDKKVIISKDRIGSRDLFYTFLNNDLFFSNKFLNLKNGSNKDLILDRNYAINILSNGIYKFGSYSSFNEFYSIIPGNYIEYNLNSNKIDCIEYFKIRSMSHSDDLETTITTITNLLKDNNKLEYDKVIKDSKFLLKKNKIKLNCTDLYNFIDEYDFPGNIQCKSLLKNKNYNNKINYILIDSLFYLNKDLNKVRNLDIYKLLNKKFKDKEYTDIYIKKINKRNLDNIPLDYVYNDIEKNMKIKSYKNLQNDFNKINIINNKLKDVKFYLSNYMIIEYMYNVPYNMKAKIFSEIFNIKNINKVNLDNKIKYNKDIINKFNEILNDDKNKIQEILDLKYIKEIYNNKNKKYYLFGEIMDKYMFISFIVQLEYWIKKYNIKVI